MKKKSSFLVVIILLVCTAVFAYAMDKNKPKYTDSGKSAVVTPMPVTATPFITPAPTAKYTEAPKATAAATSNNILQKINQNCSYVAFPDDDPYQWPWTAYMYFHIFDEEHIAIEYESDNGLDREVYGVLSLSQDGSYCGESGTDEVTGSISMDILDDGKIHLQAVLEDADGTEYTDDLIFRKGESEF